jgi:DNA adenine methylase
LEALSKVNGKFLLSSYPSKILYDCITKYGWYTKQFSKPLTAKKAIAGKSRDSKKTEVLTANYPLK